MKDGVEVFPMVNVLVTVGVPVRIFVFVTDGVNVAVVVAVALRVYVMLDVGVAVAVYVGVRVGVDGMGIIWMAFTMALSAPAGPNWMVICPAALGEMFE